MKKMKCIVGVALGLTFTACGGGSGGGTTGNSGQPLQSPQARSYSGTMGSCTIGNSWVQMCMEFSYSGVLTSDPSSAATSYARTACSSKNSPSTGTTTTFASGATCGRSAAVGFCSISSSQTTGGQSFSARAVVVFEAPFTTSLAQTLCTSNYNGTFSATSP